MLFEYVLDAFHDIFGLGLGEGNRLRRAEDAPEGGKLRNFLKNVDCVGSILLLLRGCSVLIGMIVDIIVKVFVFFIIVSFNVLNDRERGKSQDPRAFH